MTEELQNQVNEQGNRLDRLENLAATILTIAQQNRQDVSLTNQRINRLADAFERLDERLTQFIDQIASEREEIREVRGDIRGIRLEVNRIVEHLFEDNE